jgi:flavorubredoxin
MALYDRLSKYETDKGIVICYGTMYGNTERMAEIIARSASQNGIKNIVMYNVSKTDHSYILRDVFRFNGLIVGAPTYNAGLYHEMDVLLAELANKNIKNHYLGWFGSYCWASKAVAKIKQWNDLRLHFTPVGTPVDMIQGFSAATKKQCEALGKAMADQLNTLPDD